MKKIPLLELLIKYYPENKKDYLYSRIMCGEVQVNGEKITDPGHKVHLDSTIKIVDKGYVSRGGLKLKAALDKWNINTTGKVFIDAGSSTGGFTDCLLKNNAKYVHAVDVGYNQLAYSLRTDKRVNVLEKTNIMQLKNIAPIPDAAVADLSFRSISGAGRHIINLTLEKWLIALIKPQFEIDYLNYPDFKGIISQKKVISDVLAEVIIKLNYDNLYVEKAIPSPIKGRKGNFEFLFLIKDNQKKTASSSWLDNIGQELNTIIDKLILKEVPQ